MALWKIFWEKFIKFPSVLDFKQNILGIGREETAMLSKFPSTNPLMNFFSNTWSFSNWIPTYEQNDFRSDQKTSVVLSKLHSTCPQEHFVGNENLKKLLFGFLSDPDQNFLEMFDRERFGRFSKFSFFVSRWAIWHNQNSWKIC